MNTTWSETIPYRSKRVSYLPKFFEEAAAAFQLTSADRLLDLACGTGSLAFGFAPYVGRLVGVDVEKPMLDVAQAEADRRNIEIELHQADVENLPKELGRFRIITIGKAHWFLPKSETIAALEALADRSGVILICHAASVNDAAAPWVREYNRVIRRWSRIDKANITPEAFMMGSSFSPIRNLRCVRKRRVSVEDVLTRSLAYPGTTPNKLGGSVESYIAEMRSAIEPYASEQMLEEVVGTIGVAFSRK